MPKIPLLVTPSIPDISPPLYVRRQLHTAGAAAPSTRRSWRVPTLEAIQECVIDSDPPSLPEINRLKAAVVRSKVSDGLSYLLPTDRSRVSVSSAYRVELGSMFRAPYAGVDLQAFNDDKVRSSAAAHLKPAASVVRLPPDYAAMPAQPINAGSAGVYGKYKSLVPRAELGGAGDGAAAPGASRSGARSAIVQVPLGPAEIALKEQVESILVGCRVHEAGFDAVDRGGGGSDGAKKTSSRKKAVTLGGIGGGALDASAAAAETPESGLDEARPKAIAEPLNPSEFRGLTYARKSSPYGTHRELLSAPVPRPEPPPSLARVDLSPSKVQDIWNWLTSDFHMTQFEHFISVCS